MAKLIATFDYDVHAYMNDRDGYASDPSVTVMRQADTYTVTYGVFTPLTGSVLTEDGPFNLIDLLDADSLREYRVVL